MSWHYLSVSPEALNIILQKTSIIMIMQQLEYLLVGLACPMNSWKITYQFSCRMLINRNQTRNQMTLLPGYVSNNNQY
ncbi:hypothetical protein E2C01_097985 [Portunus trituberculatus]|uniref:Uncharacterized protein n=1 Tax=Portunus trituberculatus TaxID=210409 RepID=A0A5B7K6B7_PORTR|nr:hypothetical protein [Portunus trituberculatus]